MQQVQVLNGDFENVSDVIQKYFDGLYQGNVSELRAIFHTDAWLKAPGHRRNLEQWLADVASRPIPAEQGANYAFKILSIDLVQDQAMVKLSCPLFNFNYIDFLGLLKENGQWLIVNKMYTDLVGVTL
jgi:hypothetical protein